MNKLQILKWFVYSLGVVAVLGFICAVNLSNSFALNPKEPNISTGQIIPFIPKASRVYITQNDINNYHILLYGSFVLLTIYIALFLVIRNRFK